LFESRANASLSRRMDVINRLTHIQAILAKLTFLVNEFITPLAEKKAHTTGTQGLVPIGGKCLSSPCLRAIIVSNISHVNADGNLYYVEPLKQFAFKLGGRLFYGNIGDIYTEKTSPLSAVPCNFGAKCNKIGTCTFYHDPLITGKPDIRNFVESSRKIISINNIDAINTLSIDTIETHTFYSVHSILVSLLMPPINSKVAA